MGRFQQFYTPDQEYYLNLVCCRAPISSRHGWSTAKSRWRIASAQTTVSQAVTFTGLANAAAYQGSIKQTYEIGYGIGLGIADATGSFTAGCSVSSVASDARRAGARVTFTATVPPTVAAATRTAATQLTASSLVTSITTANTALGNPITPPQASSITVATPVIQSPQSSSDDDFPTLIIIVIVAVVVVAGIAAAGVMLMGGASAAAPGLAGWVATENGNSLPLMASSCSGIECRAANAAADM